MNHTSEANPGCLAILVSDLLWRLALGSLVIGFVLMWILWRNHPIPAAVVSIGLVIGLLVIVRHRRGS